LGFIYSPQHSEVRKLNGKKICMIPSSVNKNSYQINRIIVRKGRKLIETVDIGGEDAIFKLQGRGAL